METAPVDQAQADAFAVSFLRQYRRPINMAIHLEGIPFHERDDLFQQVSLHFLDLSRRGVLHSNAGSNTLAFVMRRVRNICTSYRRESLKHRHHVDSTELPLAGNDRDALQQLARQDAHTRLHACIARLPHVLRQVMLLQLQGKEPKEIADELEMNPCTVRTRIQNARIRLRQLLTNPNLN